MKRIVLVLLLAVAAAPLAGCIVEPVHPAYGGAPWIPGHYGPNGYWIPGHYA